MPKRRTLAKHPAPKSPLTKKEFERTLEKVFTSPVPRFVEPKEPYKEEK